jgi:tripartite-type tricarboxylate transporter receptor subunit TctC
LIVPFSPGGPVDVLGRFLARNYQIRSGQSATVENKTGGAGNIGIDAVRNAKPDGTTLLVIPAGNLTINPTLILNLSFDVGRDFAPISLLASATNVIVASPSLRVSSISELVAKAKIQKISYGSPGVGSQLHLAMELLKARAGIELLHVPYRGSSQALSDLLGGHIDLLASNLPAVLSSLQSRSVVPLATIGASRNALIPEVPSLAEVGINGIDVTSWYGLLAPSGIPMEVRDALFEVTRDIMMGAESREYLKSQALDEMIEDPRQFADRIRRETLLWAEVIRTSNVIAQ